MPADHVRLNYNNCRKEGRGKKKRERERVLETHHRPNVRVWHRIKLFKPELIIWSDVDVSAPVLR